MAFGVGPSVSNSETLDVDVFVLLLVHEGGDGGDVVTRVGFACHENRSTSKFWVFFNKLKHKLIKIFSNFFLALDVVKNSSSGVAGSNRLIHIKEVGFVIPAVVVFLEGKVIIDGERAVFDENGQF